MKVYKYQNRLDNFPIRESLHFRAMILLGFYTVIFCKANSVALTPNEDFIEWFDI